MINLEASDSSFDQIECCDLFPKVKKMYFLFKKV